jgi:membrane protease YdiL (CAAX protease family)
MIETNKRDNFTNSLRVIMKRAPLTAYLVLVALISAGFIVGMKAMGKSGNYLVGAYMLGPAIAAALTRLFFYSAGFKDARLHFGKWRFYLRFWGITLGVVGLSYVAFTLLGAIRWDFSGEAFLSQLSKQMALSGQRIDDLPAGLTPQRMLLLFFVGGLTIFNIPMMIAGFGEEFGWRGLMFPLLCRTRRVAGFVIGGLIWFAWHVPLMFILPDTSGFALWQHLLNGAVLAVGTIGTFVFFAWAYAKAGTIWLPSLVHAVFNNGARSFSYFVTVKSQLLANVGLTLTMLGVVAWLYFHVELRVFDSFLSGYGEQSGPRVDRIDD